MKIFIAGHRGMVGSAIMRQLAARKILERRMELLTCSRDELDLTDQIKTREFLESARPELVIIAAAKVGGIHANNAYPAEFIYQNLMVECNLIHQSWLAGVRKLMFLGSSCIYPRLAAQPMREQALLSGPLEPTNEPYAIAKIAGIKLCESYNRQYGVDYRSIMPTNLYGPQDNFHKENSHVVPALIRRFHEAKVNNEDQVVIWGTGAALREFLHVDDMASATLHLLNLPLERYSAQVNPMLSHVNIGSGDEVSIKSLAESIKRIVGFKGAISFDTSKPDGAPRKKMDNARLQRMGWQSSINLVDGLKNTYKWFLESQETIRR